MRILAVDTAMGTCTVALLCDGAIISSEKEPLMSKQAERLVPMIETLLDEADINYSDLDVMAATVGPGSFTGLRIGIAALKGIAFATGLKTIGVTTLETVAWKASQEYEGKFRNTVVFLNARRGEVYVQRFSDSDRSEAELLKVSDISNYLFNLKMPLLITGDCSELIKKSDFSLSNNMLTENILPSASGVTFLTENKLLHGIENLVNFAPFYIRLPDAKKCKS